MEKTIAVYTKAKECLLSKHSDKSWLAGVAILALVLLVGSPVTLECGRVAPRGPVTCTKQTRLLWIIPLPAETINYVRGAHLASVPGDEYCDPCYRVELETAQGILPLKTAYTSGNSDMDIVVEKVNGFVRSETVGTLSITEPGLLSFENLFCFVGWFLFLTVASYIWEQIKSAFARGRNE